MDYNRFRARTIMNDHHTPPPATGDIIIEFHQIGHMIKVSAVDTKSLTEVSIVGPASESREVLKTTAIRKLHYVMAKKQGK